MNRYAVIENEIVVNVLVAEDLKSAKASTDMLVVELGNLDMAHIGLGYVDGVFELPDEPMPELEDVSTGPE
jgi:hypothetical protein